MSDRCPAYSSNVYPIGIIKYLILVRSLSGTRTSPALSSSYGFAYNTVAYNIYLHNMSSFLD